MYEKNKPEQDDGVRENTRGKRTLISPSRKRLSNRLNGFCSLKKLRERKTWRTSRLGEYCMTDEGKCPRAEKGTGRNKALWQVKRQRQQRQEANQQEDVNQKQLHGTGTE